jgi:hypothetical protein
MRTGSATRAEVVTSRRGHSDDVILRMKVYIVLSCVDYVMCDVVGEVSKFLLISYLIVFRVASDGNPVC